MSSLRGKLVREDYSGRGGDDWPAYPEDLCRLYSFDSSTNVVCTRCHNPVGGLRFLPETGEFVHRQVQDCALRNASAR